MSLNVIRMGMMLQYATENNNVTKMLAIYFEHCDTLHSEVFVN